jgi:hypothetical protein
MFGSNCFQFAVCNRVFFDTADCTKIIFHCAVAECPGFQFFFRPHIQKLSYRKAVCLCDKLLIFVIFQCFAEKFFRLTFTFGSSIFFLNHFTACIFYIEAIVPFFSFFSNRSFCHNCISPFDIRQSELLKCFLRVSISQLRLSYYTDSESSYITSDKRLASLCSAASGFFE